MVVTKLGINFITHVKVLRFILCTVCLLWSYAHAGEALKELYKLPSSALLLVDASQRPLISKQKDRLFTPASTIKLVTALAALERWGRNHRFSTEFYLHSQSNALIVKGLGDPFLISEELDVIAGEIKRLGVERLAKIIVDGSYFESKVNLSNQSKTNNPYHALASALAVNFNTIEVEVTEKGIISAEAQTPLTPLAKSLAQGLPIGRQRINLGYSEHSSRYFVELLSAKLRKIGIWVGESNDDENNIQAIDVSNTKQLFIHANTRTLAQVVSAMLEYSNNFIANQLFLLLGVERYGPPASLDKSQRMLRRYLDQQFVWDEYTIEDGSGLSRLNQLSAKQLIDVLTNFAPYRDLMPQQSPKILAKSGTLKGVSCYAGYLHREDEWQAFAMLINQPVPYRFRERLAEELLR